MKSLTQNGAAGALVRMRGMTLMELMIVVAIVGILAAISYPSYQEYVRRGNRSDGRGHLLDAAARMERFYSDGNQYATTLAAANISATSESGHYTIAIGALGANNQTFTLTATPTFIDTKCGNLTLDHQGTRTEGGTGTVADCWGK